MFCLLNNNFLPMLRINPTKYPEMCLLSAYIGLTFYIFGVVSHFGSDCQKYFILSLQAKYNQKRKLITTGFFRYTRNPNYFGEMLIYSGFCLMSGHLVSFTFIFLIWLIFFFPQMTNKDVRMSRHAEWE